MFKESYPLKNMWNAVSAQEEEVPGLQAGDKNKISVYARFSPKRIKINISNEGKERKEGEGDEEENEDIENQEQDVEVTLPLHQRLSMIKMSHNLKSNRQVRVRVR
jgi:hypothetical protein